MWVTPLRDNPRLTCSNVCGDEDYLCLSDPDDMDSDSDC